MILSVLRNIGCVRGCVKYSGNSKVNSDTIIRASAGVVSSSAVVDYKHNIIRT